MSYEANKCDLHQIAFKTCLIKKKTKTTKLKS